LEEGGVLVGMNRSLIDTATGYLSMQYDARGMGLVRRGDDRHEVFLFEFVCGPLEEGKDMKSIVVPFDNSRWYGLESVRKMVN
jgi:hypothetical protein